VITKCKESLVISIDLVLPSTFMEITQMFRDGGDAQDEERKDDEADDA
jgi:hypothetical protein